jgi:hypothetical protein
MRILFGFLLAAAATAGEAHASSFVTLEPLETSLGPSMIVLGEPSPSVMQIPAPAADPVAMAALSYPYPGDKVVVSGDRVVVSGDRVTAGDRLSQSASSSFVTLSRSMIALGEPPVAFEKVAAIAPQEPSSRPRSLPLVIRGGVLGDAFVRSAPASVAITPEPTQEATSAPAGGPASPRREEPTREPVAPAPAPVAPAPPTRSPE